MGKFGKRFGRLMVGFLLVALFSSPGCAAIIGVAAGIAPVVEELMGVFVKQGGEPMEIAREGAGALARQMSSGAPYELYLGDAKWAEWLEKQGKIVDRAVFALGLMAIWSPESMDVFPDDGVFAVPDPESTAYGPLAKAFLEKRGVWEKAMSEGRVLIGGSAPQVVLMAEKGTAKLAFIPATLAVGMKNGMFTIVDGFSVEHAGGVTPEASENVKAFWKFLRTSDAMKLWSERGFAASDGKR